MWREFGFFLVFLFPLVVVYLTGGPDKEPLLDDHEYERRKRKLAQLRAAEKAKSQPVAAETTTTTTSNKKKQQKKKNNAAKKVEEQNKVEVEEEEVVVSRRSKKNKQKAAAKAAASGNNSHKSSGEETVKQVKKEEDEEEEGEKKQQQIDSPNKKNNKNKNKTTITSVAANEEEIKKVEKPKGKEEREKVKEIDDHMDPTANYARVMRIKPEAIEDEWEAVPYEEGWSQVKSRRPHNSNGNHIDVNAEINNVPAVANAHLDKKQRENLNRSIKKKEAKEAADKLQQERFKKHQKELEKIKIQEFYSSGKGKNTQWGKNGQKSSSKVPQSIASVNEFGQLIWD